MKEKKGINFLVLILLLAVIVQGLVILHLLPRQQIKKPSRILPKPPVAIEFKGKIAIVLDDWGYTLNNFEALKKIKAPLTLSVLPNLPFSKPVSSNGHAIGCEIILHLPLEPKERMRLEKNTILTSMDETTVRNILANDLESIAYVKGASNHMGSQATCDNRIMTVILKELKKRQMFFLDSFVSGDSVCSELAKQIGISFARRDIFLDNQLDPAAIKLQINRLKTRAAKHGSAIGIGHDRKVTLEVLKEVIPQLEKEGYKIVRLSELVK